MLWERGFSPRAGPVGTPEPVVVAEPVLRRGGRRSFGAAFGRGLKLAPTGIGLPAPKPVPAGSLAHPCGR